MKIDLNELLENKELKMWKAKKVVTKEGHKNLGDKNEYRN